MIDCQTIMDGIMNRVLLRRTLFVLGLNSLLICSCLREEEIDFKYSSFDQKLNVECYLCPELDTIYALVTRTINWDEWFAFDSLSYYIGIRDAEVQISQDSIKWDTMVINTKGMPLYRIASHKLDIQPGKKYYIRATASGFPTVRGSTIIPDTIARWTKLDTLGRIVHIGERGSTTSMSFRGEWNEPDPNLGYFVSDQHLNLSGYSEPFYSGSMYSQQNSLLRYYPSNEIMRNHFTDHILMEIVLPTLFEKQRSFFFLITGNSDFKNYSEATESFSCTPNVGSVLGSSPLNSVIPKYFTNMTGGFGVFAAFRYCVDSIDIAQ